MNQVFFETSNYKMSSQEGSLIVMTKTDGNQNKPASPLLSNLIRRKEDYFSSFSYKSIPFEQISDIQLASIKLPDVKFLPLIATIFAPFFAASFGGFLAAMPQNNPWIALLSMLAVCSAVTFYWRQEPKSIRRTVAFSLAIAFALPWILEAGCYISSTIDKHMPSFVVSFIVFARNNRTLAFPVIGFLGSGYLCIKWLIASSSWRLVHFFRIYSTSNSSIALNLETEDQTRGIELVHSVDSVRKEYVDKLHGIKGSDYQSRAA